MQDRMGTVLFCLAGLQVGLVEKIGRGAILRVLPRRCLVVGSRVFGKLVSVDFVEPSKQRT